MDSATHLTHGMEDPKARAPAISLFLAYIAMVPIASGAAATVMFRSPLIERLTTAWAGSILCFLAGVRRGLSFRQPGGSTLGQLVGMLWVFVIGTAALLMPWRVPSLLVLLLGYGSEAVLGPAAARAEETPRYFARLRPVQMMIPVASLLVLLATERLRADAKPPASRVSTAL